MEFEPKTEREIRDAMVLTPGVYDFEVIKAEEKTSKKGNAMIELTLNIFPDDGKPRIVRDWLLGSMELKLNRFCRATGLEQVYNEGAITAFACEGVGGKVKLTVDSDPNYGDRNGVKDYIPAAAVVGELKADTAPEIPTKKTDAKKLEEQLAAAGDDIPF